MVHTLQQNQMQDYGYMPQNLLINPGFEIWQRGTSAFTSDDIFTSDEWKVKRHASDTLQIDDESTIIQAGTLSLKATKTGTNDVAYVRQGIEAYKDLEGATLTFSAWVYANAASGARLVIQDYVSAEEPVYSDYHAGDSQWAQLTVTKAIRTGLASYASFPHSFGLAVGLQLADKAVTAYIDSASLVLGKYPEGVPFIPLNPADDLTRCQRFCELVNHQVSGYATTSFHVIDHCYFNTEKYAAPTVTQQGTYNMINVDTGDSYGLDIIHNGGELKGVEVDAQAASNGMVRCGAYGIAEVT